MRIRIGTTRSGKTVSASEDGVQIDGVDLRANSWSSEDWFDVYCILTCLRAKEEGGWLLVPDGSILISKTLPEVAKDFRQEAAIEGARNSGYSRTVFDDLRIGRQLVFPEYR